MVLSKIDDGASEVADLFLHLHGYLLVLVEVSGADGATTGSGLESVLDIYLVDRGFLAWALWDALNCVQLLDLLALRLHIRLPNRLRLRHHFFNSAHSFLSLWELFFSLDVFTVIKVKVVTRVAIVLRVDLLRAGLEDVVHAGL